MIRVSSLPRIMKCAASAVEPAVRIETESASARIGTSVHRNLQSLIETGSYQEPSDEEEATLTRIGSKMWDELSNSFPNPKCEVLLAGSSHGAEIVGHADVLSVTPLEIRVLDWKTGRVESDHSEQIRGYLALSLLEDPFVDHAVGFVAWIRTGSVERYEMHRSELDSWKKRIETQVDRAAVFSPGAHCCFCPRAHECEARTAMVRQDAAAILAADVAVDMASMSPEQLIALHRRTRDIVRIASDVRDALRDHLAAAGPVSHDGTELSVSTERRRSLDTDKAWPVLERFIPDGMSTVVDVSLTRAEKAAGKRRRELIEALEAAGAITVSETRRIKEVRK